MQQLERPCQGPTFTLANNTNRRTPYIIQWIFNVQRQLGAIRSVEAGYIGNGGHKLELLRVWNQPVLRKGPERLREACYSGHLSRHMG